MMNELIDQFDGLLARCRSDYHRQLQLGIPELALDPFQAQLRLELLPNFRLLYRWRNGQNPNCSASLIHNWMFSPLEEVISTKEMLAGMIGTDFEDQNWWKRGWVPFLSNGSGDHLCLDLTAELGGMPGQLISFWHDWDNRSVKFANLETWLRDVVKSIAGGR
jgi:cell wall assembly regulator SMI1